MRIFFYDETKEKKKTRKELWKDYERSRACSRDVSLAWHDTRVDFTWSTLNWRFVRSIFRFSIQSSSCRHVTRIFSCLLLFLMVNKAKYTGKFNLWKRWKCTEEETMYAWSMKLWQLDSPDCQEDVSPWKNSLLTTTNRHRERVF